MDFEGSKGGVVEGVDEGATCWRSEAIRLIVGESQLVSCRFPEVSGGALTCCGL